MLSGLVKTIVNQSYALFKYIFHFKNISFLHTSDYRWSVVIRSHAQWTPNSQFFSFALHFAHQPKPISWMNRTQWLTSEKTNKNREISCERWKKKLESMESVPFRNDKRPKLSNLDDNQCITSFLICFSHHQIVYSSQFHFLHFIFLALTTEGRFSVFGHDNKIKIVFVYFYQSQFSA